ncbi:MAG: B12-binding domain-containing radical SAM protein [Kiritimatiellaeota bacterium]|nr:B12-binding domain-containing radical SAM protein [Kiritimatiellota bacterium]
MAEVVLTADRTLTADYGALFDGMAAASQTTFTPDCVMRYLVAPAGRVRQGRSPMPLGLRRVEAAIVRSGFSPDAVHAVPSLRLREAVGPETRVVGVSSGDPLGVAMNSTTMTAILPGRIHTAVSFQRIMRTLQRLRTRYAFRVVVGGPGAWQLAAFPDRARQLGVDHVVQGYCEGNVGAVFARAASGVRLPFVIQGRDVSPDEIPAILGPTTMGIVELSRGCGLGCDFCVLKDRPMAHLPVRTVLEDVRTNIEWGARSLAVATEDVLRYGAKGVRPEVGVVIELLERLRARAGHRLVQVDHVNVCSVAAISDRDLQRIRELLAVPGQRFVWANIGVETVNGQLLAANGGRAKLRPYAPDEWAAGARDQVLRLVKAGFFPLVSLVTGLPGETPGDVRRTREWVRELRKERLAVFPLVYAPLSGPDVTPRGKLSREQWRLLEDCYRLNFRWVLALVAEHERLGGAPLVRRLLIQALGRGQVLFWKSVFRLHR